MRGGEVPGSILGRCGDEKLKCWGKAWEQNGIGGRSWGEASEKWKMVEMGVEGVKNRDFQKCWGMFFQRRGIQNIVARDVSGSEAVTATWGARWQ